MSLFSFLSRRAIRPVASRRRLALESLEARDVPAVTLADVPGSDFPSNKPLFVPITATASDGTVNYTVSSNNAGVSAEVFQGGRSVRLTVTGTDSNGTAFSGDLTLRLFEADAPLATGNIVSLINQGYYDGKLFHRVVNDFVIQGGSPNGDGKGGSSLVSDVIDEYDTDYTFASRGIVAMANAGDDNNNAQFFITDPFILSGGSEVPAPLNRRSEALNFNHTIVGILTSGFELYQQIMNVPRSFGNDGAVSKPNNPVTITKASVITDDRNAVIRITSTGGFLGSSDITVTADQAGDIKTKTFAVNSVTDTVNDRPFLGSVTNISTKKNTATEFTLPFTELDAADTQTFAVGKVLQTTDGFVWSELDSSQATASVNAAGKVTITPAAGFVGNITVTVGVRDNTDRVGSKLFTNDARNYDTQIFTLNVTDTVATNTAPTISGIDNQTTAKNINIDNLPFTVGDAETPAANLTVTAASSDPSLVPVAGIVISRTGANRTVSVKPVNGAQTGTVTITLTVTDGGNLTAVETFVVTLTESTTPPTISDIANQSTKQSTATGAIAFTVGDAETPAADLTVTFSSSNLTLIPLSGVTIGGSGANRTITLNPATGQSGTATITVTVRDAANATTSDTFTLTVTAPVTVTLTSTKTATTIGRPVLFTATVSSGTGTMQFLDGTTILGNIPIVDGMALLSTSFNTAATHAVTAKFVPNTGDTTTSPVVNVAVTSGTGPVVITADGVNAGTRGDVIIRNQDGTVRSTVSPFGSFTGGVRVKVADVTNDGQLDVIAVPGSGGAPIIVVYDGATGKETFRTMIFEESFRGGLNIDVGDAKGLGYAQILVGAGVTGGPRVNLYDAVQRKSLLNYFAYESTNRGGVSVALSDLRGGNVNNIITGAGTGLAPNVNVYNPFQIVGFEQPDLYGTFIAGSKADTTGIRVGTGPLIDNTRRDVLVGPVNPITAPLSQSFNPIALGVFVG